ncbi:MAG: hypothetical protein RLZZ290_830, partial [Pseudomonadota bacterium]
LGKTLESLEKVRVGWDCVEIEHS